MIRFGTSGMPPEGMDDAEFLDGLATRGHGAFELAFVKGFPWSERRCAAFGAAAARRDISLSIHAPYFAILTSDDQEKAKQTRSALEHTLKLGREMEARIVVAHTGYVKDRTPGELHALVERSLEELEPKVRHLGVALGLEVGGHQRAFGTLGDIALIAERFTFVRPVVDWAHVHATSGGALTSSEAFSAVFAFLREHYAGWVIDPLHCQFTDNEFGPRGEIRHVPYGEGTLRVAPLVEAAAAAGFRLTLISEAHDDVSHEAIGREVAAALETIRPMNPDADARPLGSGRVRFPEETRVVREDDGFVPAASHRPVRLRNIDKQFFPGGETKGDLLQYYAAVAPLVLPHLRDRAIVMARFPEGADGPFFYEKRAPSHVPDWLPTAPLWSQHAGETISFVTAPDVESLMWMVNGGAIEIHPWLSRIGSPDRPDAAVFDLDPAEGATWDQVATVAGLLEVVLHRLGMVGYPKTSGATGLHVYVPIEPEYPYERVRRFVESVGRLIVAADPSLATMEWDIPKRAGRVFIDHNQNMAGKTIASVYSVRPRVGAPVSTPVLWDEIGGFDPSRSTIATIWERLRRYGDLFAPALRGGQTLERAETVLGLS
jgi:bifunctional non-homologous end joining protein LigD